MIVDSDGLHYIEPMPFLVSKHERPKDRLSPTFIIGFGGSLRFGKVAVLGGPLVVKTDATGETAEVARIFRTPTTPGQYQFQILRIHNPDGWVEVSPTRRRQRTMKDDAILWRCPVTVVKKQ